MPNIKSQVKRDQTNKAAAAANSSAKADVRTAIKKVEAAVKAANKEEAKAALAIAISKLDKLAQSGVISANSANRKKAHLQGLVASL